MVDFDELSGCRTIVFKLQNILSEQTTNNFFTEYLEKYLIANVFKNKNDNF